MKYVIVMCVRACVHARVLCVIQVAELERASGARINFELQPFPCMVAKGTPIQRRSAWQASQQVLFFTLTTLTHTCRHAPHT